MDDVMIDRMMGRRPRGMFSGNVPKTKPLSKNVKLAGKILGINSDEKLSMIDVKTKPGSPLGLVTIPYKFLPSTTLDHSEDTSRQQRDRPLPPHVRGAIIDLENESVIYRGARVSDEHIIRGHETGYDRDQVMSELRDYMGSDSTLHYHMEGLRVFVFRYKGRVYYSTFQNLDTTDTEKEAIYGHIDNRSSMRTIWNSIFGEEDIEGDLFDMSQPNSSTAYEITLVIPELIHGSREEVHHNYAVLEKIHSINVDGPQGKILNLNAIGQWFYAINDKKYRTRSNVINERDYPLTRNNLSSLSLGEAADYLINGLGVDSPHVHQMSVTRGRDALYPNQLSREQTLEELMYRGEGKYLSPGESIVVRDREGNVKIVLSEAMAYRRSIVGTLADPISHFDKIQNVGLKFYPDLCAPENVSAYRLMLPDLQDQSPVTAQGRKSALIKVYLTCLNRMKRERAFNNLHDRDERYVDYYITYSNGINELAKRGNLDFSIDQSPFVQLKNLRQEALRGADPSNGDALQRHLSELVKKRSFTSDERTEIDLMGAVYYYLTDQDPSAGASPYIFTPSQGMRDADALSDQQLKEVVKYHALEMFRAARKVVNGKFGIPASMSPELADEISRKYRNVLNYMSRWSANDITVARANANQYGYDKNAFHDNAVNEQIAFEDQLDQEEGGEQESAPRMTMADAM